ncbi:unnamed protein product [Paramecium sonneborni]|uniref:Uncharacterized protein n=1 Tax=Paramecium sonneborni TaxID=65129 RepID=A0A8S1NBY3_9CILI|nr:unnamed protein product [Paramecium sonneborni]
MCIEEVQIDRGFEKFVGVAMKYYSYRYGSNKENWREKAEIQWNGLPMYKDKIKVLEFMQNKIKELESPSIKITKFFKQKSHIDGKQQEQKNEQIKEQCDIEEQARLLTVQKTKKTKYSEFYEDNYWRLKLENQFLTHDQIEQQIIKIWEKVEDREHYPIKQKISF